MSRAFADHNTGGAQTKEGPCRRSDKSGACVYGSRQIFHQIWLEENRLAKNVQAEQPQSIQKERLDLL
jgi:hypothetical protein